MQVERTMLREYTAAAMERARYEILPEDGGYYGEIPVCPGVWAHEPELEACRNELLSALEDWILVRVAHGAPLPEIAGLKLVVSREEAA